jgi:hypothetical protein
MTPASSTMSVVPDPIFADPRLAALYDIVDDDRSDLDVYAAIVEELRAWTDLIEVQQPLVSFRHVFRFAGDDTELVSDSTLRFRGRDEISESLDAAGILLRAIRDAPDRPGLEFVFLAQRDVERR